MYRNTPKPIITIHHRLLPATNRDSYNTNHSDPCLVRRFAIWSQPSLNQRDSTESETFTPIPDFQTIMLPLLQAIGDGNEHHMPSLTAKLAEQFQLSAEELQTLLPSGWQTVFYNRVGWARTYLGKAGLLEMPRRSYCRITERGKSILKRNPAKIDMKFLEQFPEFVALCQREGGLHKQKDSISAI